MSDFEMYASALSIRASDGALIWRKKPSARVQAGSVAGALNHDGYIRIGFKRKMVFAHRVVWLLTHGAWPQGEIDHINGDRGDNRPENLRDVPHYINTQNRRRCASSSTVGVQGVRKTKRKSSDRWYASIRVDGKDRYLGVADSVEEAHSLYVSAKRRLHAGCTL